MHSDTKKRKPTKHTQANENFHQFIDKHAQGDTADTNSHKGDIDTGKFILKYKDGHTYTGTETQLYTCTNTITKTHTCTQKHRYTYVQAHPQKHTNYTHT